MWRVLGVWQIEQGYHDYSLLPFITTSPKENYFFLCGLGRKKKKREEEKKRSKRRKGKRRRECDKEKRGPKSLGLHCC